MFALARLALASAVLAILALDAHAAIFPTVPQSELGEFCHRYGPGHHLATFFMDDGLRLRGHVNCNTVTFALSLILPPLDEEIAG